MGESSDLGDCPPSAQRPDLYGSACRLPVANPTLESVAGVLEVWIQSWFDAVEDAATQYGHYVPAILYSRVRDIGSLASVDWEALAEAFLEEIVEEGDDVDA